MFKKIWFAAAALGVCTLTLLAFTPSTASAEEPSPDVFLRGAGVLEAHGDGIVAVKGAMDYHVQVDGGILLVKDLGGGAEIEVGGDGRKFEWNGFTVYFGVGRAHIVGRDVAVIVAGNDIDLHVAGKGWAFLKGDGRYTVNGHGPFPWTEDGVFAALP